MNRMLLAVLIFLAGACWVRAETPEEQYVRIYGVMQSAETLDGSGQMAAALARYREAEAALQGFQKMYPDWNPRVVKYRLEFLAAKIAVASAKTPAAASKPEPTAAPVTPAANPEAAAGLQNQLATLEATVRQLQGDKTLLEARLKEALAAQPAAADPRELARVQEQLRELMKENELLKTTPAPAPAAAGKADKQALEDSRKALTEANRKLTAQTQAAKNLSAEREALQTRIKSLSGTAADVEKLRAENEALRQRLAEGKPAPKPAKPSRQEREETRKLLAAEKRIAALEADKETLLLEKRALEGKVKTLTAEKSKPVDDSRIRKLEAERDELARKLAAATQEPSGRRGRAAASKMEELSSQIDGLRARIQVFEARAVPYTSEELALFQKPATQLAATAPPPKSEKKAARGLPSGVTELAVSAQRHFNAKEFDQAEQDYLEILRRDESNAYTLANLATIQMEKGQLADAEKNARQALASAPDDTYALLTLGQITFRREKYDDSLDALSRAAKLKPQSAEIQNSLGVTLTHKGLRDQAEQAYRRAIVINPSYADAHYNLAVFYGTKDTSFVNLARWHYQRAIAGGHAANPDLEKVLDSKAGTDGTK